MWGGTLEVLVVAHIYEVHFIVFTKCSTSYKCILDTEIASDIKGNLWLHDGHYDSLETSPDNQGEGSESKVEVESPAIDLSDQGKVGGVKEEADNKVEEKMDIDSEVSEERPIRGAYQKKRIMQRNRLSLTRTTTQYSQFCGICSEFHTRRRASVLCDCGQYVHLKCLGFRRVEDLFACVDPNLRCHCKANNKEANRQATAILRKTSRQRRIFEKRNMQNNEEEAEGICVLIVASLCVAIASAQEQKVLCSGTYVRLHGLKNALYNGSEGMVVRRESKKAQVQLASNKKIINVPCKNVTIMPTYKISRCKLMKHNKWEFEPVFFTPQILSGTFYDILKVHRSATSDEIRRAFRKLSVQFHPDKNPHNAEKATLLFQQILEAYECLVDVGSRGRYDAQLEAANRWGWWGWQ